MAEEPAAEAERPAEEAEPQPHAGREAGIDQADTRRRIAETRARLKAKAFDATMSAEGLEQPTSLRRTRVRAAAFERPASEDANPYQRQRQLRLLRRLLWVVVIVGTILVLAVVVYARASHAYEQGKAALAAHRYHEAIDHFAAARLLVVPYKNTDALTNEAEAALKGLAAAAASAQAVAQKRAALAAPITAALVAGRYHDAAAALRAARATLRSFVFEPDASTAPLIALAVRQLTTAARASFAAHTWSAALANSHDVLAFEPANSVAKGLLDDASRAMRAAPVYAQAVAAAAKKDWRTVVRLAKRTLAIDAGYPAARVLLARAQAALAPPPPAATTSPAPVHTIAPAPAPVQTVAPPPPPPP